MNMRNIMCDLTRANMMTGKMMPEHNGGTNLQQSLQNWELSPQLNLKGIGTSKENLSLDYIWWYY